MKLIKKNRTSSDCGIVAAFNAASWCNVGKSYNYIVKTAASCGYSSNKGIWPFQFVSLTKKLKIPAKKIKPKNFKDLKNKLYDGKLLIIFCRRTEEMSGHIVSLFMDHEGSIVLVNPNKRMKSWVSLVRDISINGIKEFHIYEIPRRRVV